MSNPAVAAGTAADDLFSQHRERLVAASLPTAGRIVFAVSVAYVVGLALFRPGQLRAAIVPYALQVVVPLVAWGLMGTRLRVRAQAVALGADLAYTACLSGQFFIPETSTSGTSSFLAVKMLATALFFPWSARVQYFSSGATVALYFLCLAITGRPYDEPSRLHIYLGPLIAAVLSAAGAARGDGMRRDLFRRDVEREELLARSQMILDRMPIGCIVTDTDFRFTYWNPAAEKIFGWSFEEVRNGHPFDTITPPAEHRRGRAIFRRLEDGQMLDPGISENVTKDGRTIVCEWSGTPLRTRDGTFMGTLSTCQDVTARERDAEEKAGLLEELQAASRLKSDFVATMSHELRTPLNVILGYNELLLEEAFGGLTRDQSDVLQRVGQSASELLELIDATLDVSRLESGRVVLVKKPVQLAELAAQIDVETREAQTKPAVRVQWLLGPELPPIHTDPAKLKVVLKNLFTNALKFTDRGEVVVSGEERGGGVEVSVADTGIGISQEALPIIFEAFRQVDGSTTRRHGGVGLGLYIVRRLVDMLEGRVSVESQLGRGTTFRVWLPRG